MIEVRDVSKWYDKFQVLADCTTSVAKGEVVVVCGPSGSGKSTLIKCVNALEPFQQGDITVNGTSLTDPKTDLPKLRSHVGMVFQHFELFPHMTIAENASVVPRLLGWPRSRRWDRAREMLALVHLDPDRYAERYPQHLSGGQQQRVALARALATGPRMLLLDEPLGSLDRALRERLTGDLRALLSQPGVTALRFEPRVLAYFAQGLVFPLVGRPGGYGVEWPIAPGVLLATTLLVVAGLLAAAWRAGRGRWAAFGLAWALMGIGPAAAGLEFVPTLVARSHVAPRMHGHASGTGADLAADLVRATAKNPHITVRMASVVEDLWVDGSKEGKVYYGAKAGSNSGPACNRW